MEIGTKIIFGSDDRNGLVGYVTDIEFKNDIVKLTFDLVLDGNFDK